MLGMNKWLAKREKDGKPVQVGLVGAGQMGRGMVAQIQQMKGMEVAAVCDIVPENAAAAYLNAGIPADRIERCNRLSQATTAVEKGRWVATEYADIVFNLPMVDVVIDATGVPEIGAKVAYHAIQNGKHIVMLNVEADVTVGAHFEQVGAKCRSCVHRCRRRRAGRDHGAARFCSTRIGFEIIALGKGKNNPMRLDANPDTVKEEGEKQKARTRKC